MNTLCTYRPGSDDLKLTAELDASLRGLSAVPISWSDELETWKADDNFDDEGNALPIRTHGFDVQQAVRSDMRALG